MSKADFEAMLYEEAVNLLILASEDYNRARKSHEGQKDREQLLKKYDKHYADILAKLSAIIGDGKRGSLPVDLEIDRKLLTKCVYNNTHRLTEQGAQEP